MAVNHWEEENMVFWLWFKGDAMLAENGFVVSTVMSLLLQLRNGRMNKECFGWWFVVIKGVFGRCNCSNADEVRFGIIKVMREFYGGEEMVVCGATISFYIQLCFSFRFWFNFRFSWCFNFDLRWRWKSWEWIVAEEESREERLWMVVMVDEWIWWCRKARRKKIDRCNKVI